MRMSRVLATPESLMCDFRNAQPVRCVTSVTRKKARCVTSVTRKQIRCATSVTHTLFVQLLTRVPCPSENRLRA